VRQVERLDTILDGLASHGSVSVAELARRLAVSEATVRRDLELLEDQRLLARTHGGAVTRGVAYELPLRYRGLQHAAEKRRIAAAAAALAPDGLAVGLTGGTTTTEVARVLAERESLTVVTNAINIASDLAIRPNIKLVVTGGVARPESYELVGPQAEATLAGINLDVVFVGADGVDARTGVTTHQEIEAHTNRALIDRARRVVVVADRTKIGRVTFARICDIRAVHTLITDDEADGDALAAIAGADVEIVRA
jgi:DeoR family transcriptional regulator, aga operon transcriptional repressor